MRPCFSHPALVIVGNCCPACNCPSPAAHRISTNLRYQARQPSNWCADLPSTRPEHWPSTTPTISSLAPIRLQYWAGTFSANRTHSNAELQLQAASGSAVTFLTGLALLNSETGTIQTDCVPFTVHFRTLDDARIERYLQAEQPFDCAGSFKAEGLGISLFRSTEGEDVTSLVGLPLIRLVDMLLNEGIDIPDDAHPQLAQRRPLQPSKNRQTLGDAGSQFLGETIEWRLLHREINDFRLADDLACDVGGTAQTVDQPQLQCLLAGPDQP